MTPEPTEAQIKEACEKANALIRTIVPPNVLTKISVDPKTSYIDDAFVRLVMEHEAFRQRVSEIAKEWLDAWELRPARHIAPCSLRDKTRDLILPDPTPTPEQVLAEALGVADPDNAFTHRASAEIIVNELAKRGHHVAPLKGER